MDQLHILLWASSTTNIHLIYVLKGHSTVYNRTPSGYNYWVTLWYLLNLSKVCCAKYNFILLPVSLNICSQLNGHTESKLVKLDNKTSQRIQLVLHIAVLICQTCSLHQVLPSVAFNFIYQCRISNRFKNIFEH